MPFFPGAHNFTINGGTMNDVNGDQTINNNTTNNNNTNSNNKYETRIQDSYNDNSRNHIVQGNIYNTNAGAMASAALIKAVIEKNGLPRRNMIRGRGGRGYPPPHQLAPHDSGYPFSPPLPQAPAFSTNAAFEQPVFKSNNPFNNAAGLSRAYSAVPQDTGSSAPGNPYGPPNHYAPPNQYASQRTNHPRPQNPYSQYDGYNDEENDYEDGEQEVGAEVEGQDPYYGNHAQPNLEQPYAQNQTNWGPTKGKRGDMY